MSIIPSPDISWRADGSPESRQFGDIYFSAEDGLAETRHVFHNSNRLPEAWTGVDQFTIGETGFGTGLNFLATLELWQKTRKPGQRLHYVSVEGYPLAPADLARALANWPDLAPFIDQLVARYPAPFRGTHQLSFPNDVTLTLIEDEALPALRNLDASIDAWFLDGFAPSANPDMWSEALFAEIARLSVIGTRFATFTAAGAVRRGLGAQGFAVEKVPGFGRKRDMLAGRLAQKSPQPSPALPLAPSPAPSLAPWYQRPESARPKKVAIVGAGIAGLATAAALARANISATIFDGEGMGAGASGNPAALFMPRMAVDQSTEGQFHIAAYLHMERWLAQLPTHERSDIFRPCGVLQLATNAAEAKRFEMLAHRALLPPGHLTFLSAQELKTTEGIETGLPALLFPKGGVLMPAALLRYLKADAEIAPTSIQSITHTDDMWALCDPNGKMVFEADCLVLANGPGLGKYAQTSWLPQEPVRGQLTYLPAGVLPPQHHALVAGPYLISHGDGSALTGATYELGDVTRSPLAPTTIGHARNLDALGTAVPSMRPALSTLDPAALTGRVALRTQVPDRVPFVGAAPDQPAYLSAYDRLRHGDRFVPYPPAPYLPGLYLFGGLGARGFATAHLLAEHLSAQITGAPSPLPRTMREAVHPARFIVRALRKNIF